MSEQYFKGTSATTLTIPSPWGDINIPMPKLPEGKAFEVYVRKNGFEFSWPEKEAEKEDAER